MTVENVISICNCCVQQLGNSFLKVEFIIIMKKHARITKVSWVTNVIEHPYHIIFGSQNEMIVVPTSVTNSSYPCFRTFAYNNNCFYTHSDHADHSFSYLAYYRLHIHRHVVTLQNKRVTGSQYGLYTSVALLPVP